MRLFYLFSFSINDMTAHIYAGLSAEDKIRFKHKSNKIDTELIINSVCNALKIDKVELLSPKRTKTLTEARCIAINIMFKMDKTLTLKKAGEAFNRHHATVFHMRELYDPLSKYDRAFQRKVTKVNSIIS